MPNRLARRGAIAAARVQAPATVNVLTLPGTAGNYVSTPDAAGNSPNAELDIKMKVALPDWTPAASRALLCKWTASSAFIWRVTTAGALAFLWSTDGSGGVAGNVTSSADLSALANGAVKHLRVTSVGTVLKFWTSDDGTSWTQMGTNLVGPASMANASAAIEIGSWGSGANDILTGTIYSASIGLTVDGAANNTFDASAVTKLGTRDPSSVAAGGPWTINGSAWDWASV